LKKLILLVFYRRTENMWVPIWHDVLPLLMQAGARMVSQPPTPTGNALAGDVETLIQLLGTTNRILSRPAFDRMLKDVTA
jgi:hypothetical protein